MQCGHTQAHDDTAEHTHLQGGDAQAGGGGVGGHGFHTAVGVDHGADGGVHHQVGNGAGQGGHFLFLLGHADGNAHGKQQRQIGEHHIAALVHNIQNGIQQGAGINDSREAIGLQHCRVGEGTADAQQQARHRQQCNG